jgi:hypothetical protein
MHQVLLYHRGCSEFSIEHQASVIFLYYGYKGQTFIRTSFRDCQDTFPGHMLTVLDEEVSKRRHEGDNRPFGLPGIAS